MPANQRDNNNINNVGVDTTRLLNPEIDEEGPMFRRRRVGDEIDERGAQDERPKPKGPAWRGEYAKSIVYGGMDAIVTCFSLISSISATGGRSSVDVLILGFANLVADGISMGFGDYVSTTTEKKMAAVEKDVTQWEVDNNRRSEMKNLIQLYRSLGMEPKDAIMVTVVSSILAFLFLVMVYLTCKIYYFTSATSI